LPDGVTEEGYFYDLNKTIARIEEMQILESFDF